MRAPRAVRVLILPLAAVGLGAVTALGVVALEQAGLVPTLLPPVSTASTRAFFAAVAGAVITATAILFWVRGMLVQLTSGTVPPRVLRTYFEDRFQQNGMAYLFGAFAYFTILLFALPEDPARPAPGLAVLLGGLAAVGVLVVILRTIDTSAYTTRVDHMLTRLVEQTTEVIRHRHPPRGQGSTSQDVQESRAHGPPPGATSITADRHGYVQSIEPKAILNAAPPGTHIWVHVRTGDYIFPGRPIASVTGRSDSSPLTSVFRRHVHVGPDRTMQQDVDLGLTEITNVAVSTLVPGTNDATAAYDAIHHTAAVLRELLVRDLPPVVHKNDGGTLTHTGRHTHADHVHHAVNPIRTTGARYPHVATTLLETLGELRRQAQQAETTNGVHALEQQARLILDETRHADLVDTDRQRVEQVARSHGFLRDDEGTPRSSTKEPIPGEHRGEGGR